MFESEPFTLIEQSVEVLKPVLKPEIERLAFWGGDSVITIYVLVVFLLMGLLFSRFGLEIIKRITNFFVAEKDLLRTDFATEMLIRVVTIVINLLISSFLCCYSVGYNTSLDFTTNDIHWVVYVAVMQLVVFSFLFLFQNITIGLYGDKNQRMMTNHQFFTFSIMQSILLFPVLLVAVFIPECYANVPIFMFNIVLIISGLIYVYRFFKTFYSGFVSLCYIFLYLCTLNFIPVFAVLKLIKNYYLEIL